MTDFRTGDILLDDSEALVNTVNCVGVMGRGIARQFKVAFPQNFKAYAEACRRDEIVTGRMFVFDTHQLTGPRYIINFPTKRHWRGKSRIEDIDAGLAALVAVIVDNRIRSVAIPPLGSGLGGLDWSDVRPRIEAALRQLDGVRVVVYEPRMVGAAGATSYTVEPPRMTLGRAALVELMQRYLGGLLDTSVSLLEVHKLMYFMQVAGEPLRLRFAKAPYGPFAENLGHVLRDVEGHLIVGYGDGGDGPSKQLALIPGAVNDAASFLEAEPASRERFERVVELIEGFESPFGLELLSTVHWVLTNEPVADITDLVRRTHGWGSRKQQFTDRQIHLASMVLARGGWTKHVWGSVPG